MRTKEESHDYRYFPDPDLVPIIVNEQWIAEVRTLLPEFPTERRNRFVSEYQIPKYDADILTSEKDIADYFESVITGLKKKGAETYKMVSNWTMTDILRIANERHIGLKEAPVSPPQISELINLIVEGAISGKIAKEVFEEMLSNGKMPKEIVEEKGLLQVSDHSMIEKTIDEVLEKNRGQVESFLTGKKQVFGFFVGETMKLMRGKANPKIVNEILTNKLEKLKQ
jgi:aspartyl-tRNA(Asn)/glutamyl-tRNA(Gln) amidotransferase subunit B